MRISAGKKDRADYVAGLTDGDLKDKIMFYMVLLELITCGIKRIQDEEKEGYSIAWPLEETIDNLSRNAVGKVKMMGLPIVSPLSGLLSEESGFLLKAVNLY